MSRSQTLDVQNPEIAYTGKTGIDSQSNIRSIHDLRYLCYVSPCDTFNVQTSNGPVSISQSGVVFIYFMDSENNTTIIPINTVYHMPHTSYPLLPFTFFSTNHWHKNETRITYKRTCHFDITIEQAVLFFKLSFTVFSLSISSSSQN